MSVVEIGRYEYCTIGTYCTVFIKLNKSVSSRILQNIFNKILLTDSNRFARMHIHIYFWAGRSWDSTLCLVVCYTVHCFNIILNLRKLRLPRMDQMQRLTVCVAQKPDIIRCISSISDRRSIYVKIQIIFGTVYLCSVSLGQCIFGTVYRPKWKQFFRTVPSRRTTGRRRMQLCWGQPRMPPSTSASSPARTSWPWIKEVKKWDSFSKIFGELKEQD